MRATLCALTFGFCVALAAARETPTPAVNQITTIPRFWKIEGLKRRPVPSRIALYGSDSRAETVVTVMDHYLDLPYQVKNNTLRGGKPGVPFAPELVVGEGPHQDNHTIVKVLNRYGLAEITFLAYPPTVKGGVQVAAGRAATGSSLIVAAPIADAETKEIRAFNRTGGLVGSIVTELTPPYVVAAGDFLKHEGDEFVVCSRNGSGKIEVYDFKGNRLEVLDMPEAIKGNVRLSVERTRTPNTLAIFSENERTYWAWALSRKPVPVKDALLAGKLGVSMDAFSDDLLLLEPGKAVSTVTVVDPRMRQPKTLTVSQYENRFWVKTPPADIDTKKEYHGLHQPNFGMAKLKEGTYVKFCKYGHKRMDAASPGYHNPVFGSDDPKHWRRDVQAPDLSEERLTMWEPCFTHRGFKQLLGKWVAARDPVSKLPKYMMVSRDNSLESYKEGEGGGFSLTSYALDQPDLDHVYLDTLSAFLKNLAVRFREHPELMPSMEPNHENEIPMKHAGTRGDYNPFMIQGFYHYLVRMYGSDINAHFGTPFEGFFDAPRNMGRGEWDAYGMTNPFFREWRNYNRLVVNARLAQGFRESLLAGFPPELIKAHQIPGSYFGGEMSFSKVKTRITPIDYVISSGIGGGYTRYGVWYRHKYNFLQGSHSSGHDSVVLGEYNSLTKSNEHAAKQLTYMYDHGVSGVHVMGWNVKEFNTTMAHAVAELIKQDRPRPCAAGGVSDVKAYVDGDRTFNIAVLGAGPGKVGLLKSLKQDGTWEGSVYVSPFKAATEITTVEVEEKPNSQGGPFFEIGPINGLNGGSQIELTFEAKGSGALQFQVCRGTTVLPGLRKTLKVGKSNRHYRIIHRTQIPVDGLTLRLRTKGEVDVSELSAVRHTTQFANVYRGVKAGKRHEGGLTFDIIR